MKKFTGYYTNEAVKALKSADKIICRVTEDGAIYVTTGYTLYKMNPLEYAAVAQPVTCCEPGNWIIDKSGKRDESTFDAAKIFSDAVKAAENAGELARCPMNLDTRKEIMWSYYNADQDFASFYNHKFIMALSPSAKLRAAGATSAAVAYIDGEPFAMVLPIRPEGSASRAVKAYFTDEAAATKADAEEIAKLKRERDEAMDAGLTAEQDAKAARAVILELQEKIAQQAAELEALRSAPQAEPVNEKPEPKTAAEMIVSRFAELEGVTATIKGAQTAAPVVWLTGETEKHADAIKAAGAKWSNKKSAFYVRVA